MPPGRLVAGIAISGAVLVVACGGHGSSPVGAPCSSDSDCASGLCAGTVDCPQHCSCKKDSDCPSGQHCTSTIDCGSACS